MLVTWLDMREIEGMLFLVRFEYRILTGKCVYSQWNKIKRVFNFSFSFLVEKWDHRSRKGLNRLERNCIIENRIG